MNKVSDNDYLESVSMLISYLFKENVVSVIESRFSFWVSISKYVYRMPVSF